MLKTITNFFNRKKRAASPSEPRTIIDKSKITGRFADFKYSMLDQYHDYFQIEFTEYESVITVSIYGNHKSVELKGFFKVIEQNSLDVQNVIVSFDTGITVIIDCKIH